MKFRITIVFLILTAICSAQLRLPPERQPESLRGIFPKEKVDGKIKSIVILGFRIVYDSTQKNNVVTDNMNFSRAFSYDTSGNICSEGYWKNGIVREFIRYFYDGNLRLIKTVNLEREIIIDSIIYEENRRMITRYKSGADQFKVVYYLNERGNLLKEENYINDSTVGWVYSHRYDDYGRVVEEKLENIGEDGITMIVGNEKSKDVYPGHIYIYQYVDSAALTLIRRFEKSGYNAKLDDEIIKSKGDKTEVYKKYFNGEFSRIDSLFTKDSVLILMSSKGFNSTYGYSVTYFDSKNNLIGRSNDGSNILNQTFQYRFDDKGNWIEEKQFNKQGSIIGYRKRIFEYY